MQELRPSLRYDLPQLVRAFHNLCVVDELVDALNVISNQFSVIVLGHYVNLSRRKSPAVTRDSFSSRSPHRQNIASNKMIGSGIPISHSKAPLPKVIYRVLALYCADD